MAVVFAAKLAEPLPSLQEKNKPSISSKSSSFSPLLLKKI
jgi:hypothetical protein